MPKDTHIDSASIILLKIVADIASGWYRVLQSVLRRARAEHTPAVLTDAEAATVSIYESLLRSVSGDDVVAYSSQAFHRAISRSDKRSFKIRLVVYKVRDSILDKVLQSQFDIGMQECIAEAEERAGCVSNPSPRRMSRLEQERAADRERRKLLTTPLTQLDMFLGDKPLDAPNAKQCTTDKSSASRQYKSTIEISKDIESGKITPYSNSQAVLIDLQSGKITPNNAVLFLAELRKRKNKHGVAPISPILKCKYFGSIVDGDDSLNRRGRYISDDKDDDVRDTDSMASDSYRSYGAEFAPDDAW